MQTRLKKQVSESPVPEVQKRDIRFMSQQLVLFKPVVVTGDRGNTYKVTMKPDHIYCTCPGWKFMRAPIQAAQGLV